MFKIQDAQELNDPEVVATTWVKHLYDLEDRLNDTKTEMTGMKPNVAINLEEVKLKKQEDYPPEELLPRMVCIDIFYSPVRNMVIRENERLTGFGRRKLIDSGKLLRNLEIE